ncbi:MAG: helix-turn-helix domain-containing protein [Ferrovibrio sp.]|nr:helix-turn-helix domain-containing protein [Ferrovibrio sp.]
MTDPISASLAALDAAASIVGSHAALSGKIGVPKTTMSSWRTRKKAVPADHCLPIEQATNGQVTRHDLRPDIFGPPPAQPPAPTGEAAA